jgi:hypothetical protein
MRTLTIVTILAIASAALAGQHSSAGQAEAPRATDLLRAEKMAREARERLQLRQRPTAKWLRGGRGWSAKQAEEPRAPTIKVHPGRRTSRGRDRG